MNKLPNGWEYKKLDDLFKEFNEKNHADKIILASTQDRGVIPSDLLDRHIIRKKESLSNYKLVKKGCFVISLRSFQGGFEYSNYEGIISPAYTILEPKMELVDDFYKYYFKSYYFINKSLPKYAEGIRDGKQIKYKACKEILVPYPPLDEQKRIASALSKIDAYLENTIKLIEEKERFKKGISKKLLTCKEGENVPEMRFKEFNDKWETVRLSDICLINNKNLKGNTNKDYKFKYIDLTAVKKGNIDLSKDYITFENAPASARRIINKNDIIMATVRPYLLGHAFIDFEAKDYICSTGFAVLTANADIEMKYIYQYLYSNDMAKQIRSRLEGSTYPTIKNSAIKELKIKIPKSIKEQEYISNFLSLLDAEIDNLKEQKEEIKKMKSGIIKKLMSGEVRL